MMTSLGTDTTTGALPRERLGPTCRLAATTLAATLGLVALGGFTRGSGSGYGCADRWPLCENGNLGGLLPRWDYHMVIEWSHRWTAASVGLLAVATAVSAWRHLPQHRVVTWAATAAVAVIGVQAWVGRMVVTEDLDADLVSVHLTISMIVVALITFVVVTTAPFPPNRASDPSGDTRDWTRLVAGGAAATLTVLLLGSYVHNLYISGWPLVGGRLVPSLTNRYVAVHFVHRLGAALVMALLVYLVAASLRRDRPRAEQLLVKGAASCFATNVALGAAHVFTEVSSSALVATHLLVAALVWTQLIAATTLAARGSAARGPDSWRSARASVG